MAAPGAKVPEVRATVLTVPVPLKVPPLIVTGLLVFFPFTCKVPALTLVAPVKSLVPDKIWVNPALFNVRPTVASVLPLLTAPAKEDVPLPPVMVSTLGLSEVLCWVTVPPVPFIPVRLVSPRKYRMSEMASVGAILTVFTNFAA